MAISLIVILYQSSTDEKNTFYSIDCTILPDFTLKRCGVVHSVSMSRRSLAVAKPRVGSVVIPMREKTPFFEHLERGTMHFIVLSMVSR